MSKYIDTALDFKILIKSQDMSIEALLLPAGSAVVAAAVGVIMYKLGASRSVTRASASEGVKTPAIETAPFLEFVGSDPVSIDETPYSEPLPVSPMEEIAEAPEPFPEEHTPSITTPVPLTSTSLPTDIRAVTTMASPIAAAARMLVIPAPKRRVRAARRLPASGGTIRRKRAHKTKASTPTTLRAMDRTRMVARQMEDSL